MHWDEQAEEKVVAALLYSANGMDYGQAWDRALSMSVEERQRVIGDSLEGLGPHDAPPREFEVVDYTFEIDMDYGAFREFRRHRMQTYLPQPLTVVHGTRTPSIIREAGLRGPFDEAVEVSKAIFRKVRDGVSPTVAQYAVTHAHNRRLLSKMNLRECYHLFKLRTSPEAHESIREPMEEAMRLAKERHPLLFQHLRLRQ